MTPYRLWDRKFKDLPKEIQEKLHRVVLFPSSNDFYNSLSVEDKKALLKRECGYDPELKPEPSEKSENKKKQVFL